jgi:protein-disulfide isomerase
VPVLTAGVPCDQPSRTAAWREHAVRVPALSADRASITVAARIRRDVDSGLASGQVLGTPTLFIDGVVYRGGYDPPALLAALATTR